MGCCLHKYTSYCGTLLVDMPAPPESIVLPSLHVQWGKTPLLRAAEKGYAEIVRFLLGNGSDVEEQDNVGGSKGVLSVCDCIML